jgi:hypothetical protein
MVSQTRIQKGDNLMSRQVQRLSCRPRIETLEDRLAPALVYHALAAPEPSRPAIHVQVVATDHGDGWLHNHHAFPGDPGVEAEFLKVF